MDSLEHSPPPDALEQALALLGPLRAHRQRRAERAAEQARRELETLLNHLSDTEACLSQARDNHRRQRQSLAEAHLHCSVGLKALGRWHEREQAMLDRLAHIQQDLQRQQRHVAEQRALLENRQRQAKAALRAAEKLACLGHLLHEQG